jgi:tetratricopeptide (TPR) repeat protein
MRYRRDRFLRPFALRAFILFLFWPGGLFFHGRSAQAQEKAAPEKPAKEKGIAGKAIPEKSAPGKAAWKGYEAILSPHEAAGRYDALLAEWAACLRADPGAPGSGMILLRLRGIRGYCREFKSLAPTLRKVIGDPGGNGFVQDLAVEHLGRILRVQAKWDEVRALEKGRGHVKAWLVLGPFGHSRKGLHDEVFPVERDQAQKTMRIDKPYDGLRRKVFWRKLRVGVLDHTVEPFRILRPSRGAAFGLAQVKSPEERTGLLSFHTDHPFKLWVNGVLLCDGDRYRKELPREFAVSVRLRKGWNRILFKFSQSGDGSVALRLCDLNGFPLKDVQIEAEEKIHPLEAGPSPRIPARSDVRPEAAYARLVEANPDDPHACAALGLLHHYQDEPAKAVALLSRAVERKPDSAHLRYFKGLCFEYADHLPESYRKNRAKKAYELALKLDPNFCPARERLAYYYNRNEKFEKAVKEMEKILTVAPEGFFYHCVLSGFCMAQGWDREGVRALRKAREIHPGGAFPVVQLARHFESKGNPVEAERLFRAAHELDPARTWLLGRIAAFRKKKGDLEEAKALYRKVLKIYPENLYYRERLGELHVQERDFDSARRAFQALANEIPHESRFPRRVGEILLEAGEEEKALPWLKKSLALRPGQHTLRRLIAKIEGRAEDPFAEFEVDLRPILEKAPGKKEHPKASSLCLLDSMILRIYEDGSSTELIHQAFKILDEKGVERYGSVELPGEIQEARTITPEGEILEPIRTKRSSTILMPGLKPGAVIEYKYRYDRRRPSAFQYLPGEFYFRDPNLTEPFVLSHYVVIAPKKFPVRYFERNMDVRARVLDRGADRVWIWEARDMDRIEPEPFMPEKDEILPYVVLATERRLKDFAPMYRDGFLGATVVTPEIEKWAREKTAGVEGEYEKAKKLYREVNRLVLTQAGPDRASQVLLEAAGSRLNLLLALYEAAGIRASYVRARPNPKLTPETHWDLPRLDLFSHPLLFVEPADGPAVWVYTRYRYLPFGKIPYFLQGGTAYVLGRERAGLRMLPVHSPDTFARVERIEIELRGTGARCGFFQEERSASGYQLKEQVDKVSREQLLTFIAQRANQLFPGARVERKSLEEHFPGKGDGETPFRVRFRCTVPEWVRPQGTYFAVKTGMERLDLMKKYGGKPERQFPMVMRRATVVLDHVTVKLAKEYRVHTLPRDVVLRDAFGIYSLVFQAEEDRIEVRRTYYFLPQRIAPREYSAFIERCRRIDVAELEPILLEKR